MVPLLARGARQPGLELPIERAPVRQPGQRIGVRLVLRLLEARRVEDHRRRLLADAAEDAPVLVGEAAGDGVINHQPADQPPFERQRAGQQRRQLLAVRAAAVGARRAAAARFRSTTSAST